MFTGRPGNPNSPFGPWGPVGPCEVRGYELVGRPTRQPSEPLTKRVDTMTTGNLPQLRPLQENRSLPGEEHNTQVRVLTTKHFLIWFNNNEQLFTSEAWGE